MAHKDLEFHVEAPARKFDVKIFKSFDKAVAHAVALSASGLGEVHVDVVVWSRAAAKAYAGDYGVDVYDEDPEASVHDRIVIQAESLGRIA